MARILGISEGYLSFKKELIEYGVEEERVVNEEQSSIHQISEGEFYHPLFGRGLSYKSLVLICLDVPSMEGELFREDLFIREAKKRQLRRIAKGLESKGRYLSGASSIDEGVLLYDFNLSQGRDYERICISHRFVHEMDKLVKAGNIKITMLSPNPLHS